MHRNVIMNKKEALYCMYYGAELCVSEIYAKLLKIDIIKNLFYVFSASIITLILWFGKIYIVYYKAYYSAIAPERVL